MTVYNWLCLLGVQAFVTTSVTIIVGIINNNVQKHAAKNSASQKDQDLIKKALQCSLRKDLYEMYEKAIFNQSVTLDEQKLFLAMYESYHELYENGVMETIKDQYMKFRVVN